ncbi:MAG: efflux RND transporter permease subunit [Bacteroidota bacterium]
MSEKEVKTTDIREFKPTTIALKNKNTIFLLAIILAIFGTISYRILPKELFPDVVIPTIMVKTIYPGNSPVDMENLISRPLENEINTISEIKKLSSESTQDNSDIFVEFQTDVEIKSALQDVKDAVDRAKSELPSDLQVDPMVMEIDFSEFPIININISGDYSLNELKRYADFLTENIEAIPEISKIEMTGIEEREIQINVDPIKLNANELSFGDIENAVRMENVSISGGTILFQDNTRWAVRSVGEFTDVREIEKIIVKHEFGNIVYLGDIAEITDTYAEPMSVSRLDDQAVVSLQVVKKSGENLIAATNKIFDVLQESKENGNIPDDLNITITNDQSENIRNQLSNLENSVIMAVILIIIVLYLFLGIKNALFVGMAIPLSILTSFMVLGILDIQINMIVLFSIILALGLLVDNAIVAVDNIFRFIERGYPVFEASKKAIGEIAIPIITSTATTLSAFLPLAFWQGMVGEFMKYMPITLIIVLLSSLFVALIIIPVLSYTFFRNEKAKANEEIEADVLIKKRKNNLRRLLISIAIIAVGGLLHILGVTLLANILILIALVVLAAKYVFSPLAKWFQNSILPFNEKLYSRTLNYALRGKRPYYFVFGTFVFLILATSFFFIKSPNILFFPDNQPNFINILVDLPLGTDIKETDIRIQAVENHLKEILEPNKNIVKSIHTTVGRGAVGEMEFSAGDTPNRGRITITFVEQEDRMGVNTNSLIAEISDELIGEYPGMDIKVEKNSMGPPSGKPINIEISGKEYERLISITEDVKSRINNAGIEGIEGLRMDLDTDKPEIIINIDREQARRYGVSTYAVSNTIRTALFGLEVSSFKLEEEDIPIQLRLKEEYRNSMSSLMNQFITFRSQSTGKLMQVPISAVASYEYSKTYGSISRIDLDRVITLYSNVLPGYNANRINDQIAEVLENIILPEGYAYEFTGEQQEQQESMAFLIQALFIALAIIALILVTQFNSIIKPFIIIMSVIFSTAGVFFGLALFNMDFIIIMTGIGIISLVGVVVNNAIVLIDYTDYLHLRKKIENDIPEEKYLEPADSLECIKEAGKTRFRPVILTAITTVLGLVPLAIGLNINFITLFTDFNPQIYFGGDNAAFWSPMAWTIIFGLTLATFLTLIVVPSMYQILLSSKRKFKKIRKDILIKAGYQSDNED